jgi:hypothetical protein
MQIKPRRKPLPWWLVTILALVAALVAGAIINAVLDSGRRDGMRSTTTAAVLPGDEPGICGDCPQEVYPSG